MYATLAPLSNLCNMQIKSAITEFSDFFNNHVKIRSNKENKVSKHRFLWSRNLMELLRRPLVAYYMCKQMSHGLCSELLKLGSAIQSIPAGKVYKYNWKGCSKNVKPIYEIKDSHNISSGLCQMKNYVCLEDAFKERWVGMTLCQQNDDTCIKAE